MAPESVAPVDGAGEAGATGESQAKRLPFELWDAPPVAAADAPPSNGKTAEAADVTVSADRTDRAGAADAADPALPVTHPSPPSPPNLPDSPSAGEAEFDLGLAASRRGRWREAVTHLRRAIELDGGRAAAYCYLGEALNHVDDLPGALQACQRSVEIWPSNPKALCGMGIVLDRMNRPDDAAPLYRRSRECSSNSSAGNDGGSP